MTAAFRKPLPGRSALSLILVLYGVLATGTVSLGQITEFPLLSEGMYKVTSGKTAHATKRTKSEHALTLPFWDDFSFTKARNIHDTSSGFPLDSLWDNNYDTLRKNHSYDVWINDGVGINPPSRNVASLDGLDANGEVYDTDPNTNGIRDVLTSQPINLDVSGVATGERTSVYLSFFYQWKGFGETPDGSDYFRVDFLNNSKEWVTVATIGTVQGMDETRFYDTMIQVLGDQFFHEDFRFRFRSFGALSGRFDNWNIDYVYLDKGRTSGQKAFDDGALGSSVGPVFGEFFSIPVDHLTANAFSTFTFDVSNLRGDDGLPDPYTYNASVEYRNYSDGTTSTTSSALTPEDRTVKPGNPLLEPFERYKTTTLPEDVASTSMITATDSADVKINLRLLSNDVGLFTVNDTISRVYKIRDYYAYDDGSPEYSAQLNEADDRAAYEFTLPEGLEDDLTAIDVFIPGYTLSGFTTATFFVMNAGDDGFPNDAIGSVTQVIRKRQPDNFHRIFLLNPVRVSGRFFIGWSASFLSNIFVGLDKNNDSGQHIYVNAVGYWQQNSTLQGSLLLRPVFGEPGPIIGVEPQVEKFGVYPNPSRGQFTISGQPDAIEIISPSGKTIRFMSIKNDDLIEINVSTAPGIYILRMTKGAAVETRKIVIH